MSQFLFGVLVGAAGSSALKAFMRPLAKSSIKGFILLARRVQELQAEVAEELADIKAEAEAEIRARDARRSATPGPTHVHSTVHPVA